MMLTKKPTALESALLFARLGFGVFPIWPIDRNGNCVCRKQSDCDRPGKHASCFWTKDNTTSETRIKEQWQKHPRNGAAVVTGNGLFVIDLDVAKDGSGRTGMSDLANIDPEGRQSPNDWDTPSARTQSGGVHLCFLCQDTDFPSDAKANGTLIDWRNKGGYIVLPGSVGPKGRYEWIRHPDDVGFMELPEWLLAFLKQHKRQKTAQRRHCNHVVDSGRTSGSRGSYIRNHPGVSEGRFHTLQSLVGSDLNCMPEDEVMRDALAWGQRCDPVLPESRIIPLVQGMACFHRRP